MLAALLIVKAQERIRCIENCVVGTIDRGNIVTIIEIELRRSQRPPGVVQVFWRSSYRIRWHISSINSIWFSNNSWANALFFLSPFGILDQARQFVNWTQFFN